MRPRTFILLILVLLAAAAAAIAFFVIGPGGGVVDAILPGGDEEAAEVAESPQAEPGLPTPTPTPVVQLEDVVVALGNIPVGERIRADLVTVEQRPNTNVAVVAGVTFSDKEAVVGQIAKTAISRGQEVLRPMIALNPSDIAAMGSDLSLYVDQGKVAVAFPIDAFSGVAYSMRPGDLVDAFMSLTMVDLDEEFQTDLPNVAERVNESAFSQGQAFLFPPTAQGRLELIPNLNPVALIGPGTGKEPVPRRVTQLTMQQMEVIWVGTWRDPSLGMEQEWGAEAYNTTDVQAIAEQEGARALAGIPSLLRPETQPDLVILSLTSQDALALKWALEAGINIDLVLRAQGDSTVFATTSVSLPQIFEQGVIVAPQPANVGLQPQIDQVPTPGVPIVPPG